MVMALDHGSWSRMSSSSHCSFYNDTSLLSSSINIPLCPLNVHVLFTQSLFSPFPSSPPLSYQSHFKSSLASYSLSLSSFSSLSHTHTHTLTVTSFPSLHSFTFTPHIHSPFSFSSFSSFNNLIFLTT